jgi:hypothetical protein
MVEDGLCNLSDELDQSGGEDQPLNIEKPGNA